MPLEDLVRVGVDGERALLAAALHDGHAQRPADVVPTWRHGGDQHGQDDDGRTAARGPPLAPDQRSEAHPDGGGEAGEEQAPADAAVPASGPAT